MSDKKLASGNVGEKSKLVRKSITLEVKMEVLKRLEAGEKQVKISHALSMPTSSIRTIWRNAESIKARALNATSLTSKKLTRSRSSILEKMESRLSVWVEEQTRRHMPLSQLIIMEKAKSIFTYLKAKGEGSANESFSASRGWFDRFKRRTNFNRWRSVGTATSVDEQVAEEFPDTLKKIVERGNYPPQLVFNVDETGLFWKRLPSSTFLAREEKLGPNFKAAMDRLTLLLGGNASGDFKLKPLLVYHSETPNAMQGFSKEQLPVIWKSNKNAWVTSGIFTQWYVSYFCPAVKKYCEKNKQDPRALLILDSAPSHPQNLCALETCLPVEIVYLPASTRSILQPMDQGVIANLKALYLRCTFKQLVEATDKEDKQTLRDFWSSFNIMNGIGNIKAAWDEIDSTSMNGAWYKLWPEACSDFQRLEEIHANITWGIVQLANQAGLKELDSEDVEEVLLSHRESLTNEELKELEEQHIPEKGKSTGGEVQRRLTTAVLSEGISKIAEALKLFAENDPDWERSSTVKEVVLKNIFCYQKMLHEKKKLASLSKRVASSMQNIVTEEKNDNSAQDSSHSESPNQQCASDFQNNFLAVR